MRLLQGRFRLPFLLAAVGLLVNLAVVAFYPCGEARTPLWKTTVQAIVEKVTSGGPPTSTAKTPLKFTSVDPEEMVKQSLLEKAHINGVSSEISSVTGERDIRDVKDIKDQRDRKDIRNRQGDAVSLSGAVRDASGASSPGSGSGPSKSEGAKKSDSPKDGVSDSLGSLTSTQGTPTALASTADSTGSPTPMNQNASSSVEATPAPPKARQGEESASLALDMVSSRPGQEFRISLYCDGLPTAAGLDVALGYPAEIIFIQSVQKTSLTGSFLLLKQIRPGSISVSLAGTEPLGETSGILLTFGGIVSATAPSGFFASVSFTKAKVYDVESRPLRFATSAGGILISSGDSTSLFTPTPIEVRDGNTTPVSLETATPFGDDNSLPNPTTPTDDTPTNIPTDPDDGGGIIIPGQPKPTYTRTPNAVYDSPTPTKAIQIAPTETPIPPTPTCTATPKQSGRTFLKTDVNKDGIVNAKDLFQFIAEWEKYAE